MNSILEFVFGFITRQLYRIEALIMTVQDTVDALAVQVSGISDAVDAGVQDITAEIAALKNVNPQVDFTGVNNALAKLGASVQALTQLDDDNKPVTPPVNIPTDPPVDPTDPPVDPVDQVGPVDDDSTDVPADPQV